MRAIIPFLKEFSRLTKHLRAAWEDFVTTQAARQARR